MNLQRITCSGANEHTEPEDLVSLMQSFPKAEIGVQVSGNKAAYGSARYWWLRNLWSTMYLGTGCPSKKTIRTSDKLYFEIMELFPSDTYVRFAQIPIALHINSDWVENFGQGIVAQEIEDMLTWCNPDGSMFIQRVQLNFQIGRERTPDLEKLIATINKFSKQRFILSYNPKNADFINKIYETGMRNFDLLFDCSFGEGIMPEAYYTPVYPDVFQGYAGGLSPENVGQKLGEIAQVAGRRSIFIDAEGKLKGPDGHFSIEKCRQYLQNASSW